MPSPCCPPPPTGHSITFISPHHSTRKCVKGAHFAGCQPRLVERSSEIIAQIHPREYLDLELKNLVQFEQRKYGSTLLLFFEENNAHLVPAPKVSRPAGLAGLLARDPSGSESFTRETQGYRHHSQLIRFRLCPHPLDAVATYLVSLVDEAEIRGYAFNRSKINPGRVTTKIPVARGQILYEWGHLKAKLVLRDPLWLSQFSGIEMPESHPLFEIVSVVWKPGKRTGSRNLSILFDSERSKSNQSGGCHFDCLYL